MLTSTYCHVESGEKLIAKRRDLPKSAATCLEISAADGRIDFNLFFPTETDAIEFAGELFEAALGIADASASTVTVTTEQEDADVEE